MSQPAGSQLRIIDFGSVPPLRSQTLWHAIAYGVSAGELPTLSFVAPAAPYVCVGYHRRLAEVDQRYCRARQLPVYRRMVGGGPVYLDADQLFFQICLPARSVPAGRAAALRALLEPAVTAFRAVGVAAALDDDLEICLGDKKICGHGAGQIEDAVVVCGNLIARFDHEQAARVLALRDPAQREQTLALMRRYIAATPVDSGLFRTAMIRAYTSALGLAAVAGALNADERAALAELDARFCSSDWLRDPAGLGPRAARGAGRQLPRQVKVRAGVWTLAASSGRARVVASVVRGTVHTARLSAAGLGDRAQAAEQAVTGVELAAVPDVLAAFGAPGRALAAAFATADERRI